VLWLNGLGLIATLGLIALAMTVPDFRPFLVVGGLGVIGALALFGLLLGNPGPARVVVTGALFLAAGLGGVFAEMWLLKTAERELRAQIAKWAAPEREFSDTAAGIKISLPEGWVILKPGNPLLDTQQWKLVLGEGQVGALAALQQEEGAGKYLSVDDYLDRWLAQRPKSMDGLKQTARSNATVGKVTGRKMAVNWKTKGRRMDGWLTAWSDGPRYFGLLTITPGSVSRAVEPRFAALLQALAFEAPVATHLKEAVARVTVACPLLSAGAVESMVRSMPNDAPAELYFRRGYEWAFRGMDELGPATVKQMGVITTKLYAALTASERQALGAYLERVRAHQRTRPAEDAAMSEVVKKGVLSLPRDAQDELRQLIERAIEVGRLLS
jgi:hypothetical protein